MHGVSGCKDVFARERRLEDESENRKQKDLRDVDLILSAKGEFEGKETYVRPKFGKLATSAVNLNHVQRGRCHLGSV